MSSEHKERKQKIYKARNAMKGQDSKEWGGDLSAHARKAKKWIKPYSGATVCQGCKRPGTEATRHGGKDSLCDECARLLHIGKEIMEQRERSDKLFKETMNAAQVKQGNTALPDLPENLVKVGGKSHKVAQGYNVITRYPTPEEVEELDRAYLEANPDVKKARERIKNQCLGKTQGPEGTTYW